MTLEDLKEKMPTKVSVADAARIMGVHARYIHMGLQYKRLPFGSAVQNPGGRWSYHIAGPAFVRYMEGQEEDQEDAS